MKILAIGAHSDDIELFCGGTLLKLKDEGNKIYTLICTDGGLETKDKQEECIKARKILGVSGGYTLDFKNAHLKHGYKLVNAIDKVMDKVKPNWVFTHSVDDYHQDHIAVAKAMRSANRTQRATLITYPSYNLTIPFEANLFVDISDYFKKKTKLLKVFKSQKGRWYMRPEIIEARGRGTNIGRHIEKFKIEMMRM